MSKHAEGDAFESGLTWLLRGWLRMVEMIPGAIAAERGVLRVLRERLDEVENGNARPGERVEAPVFSIADEESPADVLERLLDTASEQTPEESRLAFFASILRRLTPDEVKLFAAVSDGTVFAVVHVGYGSRVGRVEKRVAENLSPIGRRAGVTALELVPQYLAHLRELDLVQTGPQDPALEVEYEMLETDAAVRNAVREIEEADGRPRVLRRTLRISSFGQALWDACSASAAR
ncbi:MAG: Abi-alpha family protein [Candidatus Binatia bacterium]